MSAKPTQQEEEYFARLELEQRRRDLAEREPHRVLAKAEGPRARWAPEAAEDSGILDSLRRIFTYA